MSVPRKKISFDNIWQLLLKSETTLGITLLQDQPKKKTLKEWIFKTTLIRNVLMFQGILITTLITTNFKLISLILCASMETNFISLYISLTTYIFNKKSVMHFLTWCKGLYDIEKKFHPLIQKTAETHLMLIEKKTTKILKIFRIVMYVNCFNMVFGILALGMVLPENILPKFTPPAPFYLPFKHQDNWTTFLVTISYQLIAMIDTTTVIIYIFVILFTIIVHVLGFLDIINEAVMLFGREILLHSKTSSGVTNGAKSTLDTDILKNINKSLEKTKNCGSFEEWIKILTEMISDVSLIISLLRKFYSMIFFVVEVSSFSTIFMCGLTLIVIRQQYIFVIGITFTILFFWIICYINEKILDKFDDIKMTLYDIPWYELEPKQAKTLLILLNCDEITKGFTAAGIHNLTIERFGMVIEAGYTNLVALKDLVQK